VKDYQSSDISHFDLTCVHRNAVYLWPPGGVPARARQLAKSRQLSYGYVLEFLKIISESEIDPSDVRLNCQHVSDMHHSRFSHDAHEGLWGKKLPGRSK
jgi:hypothetical protein